MTTIDAGTDLLDVRVVLAELEPLTLTRLRAMSRKGEYPELLHVSRGEYRVRRIDHLSWKEGRWTRAEQAREELRYERARAKMFRKDQS